MGTTFVYALPLNLLGYYFNTIFYYISLGIMALGSLVTICSNYGKPPIAEGMEKIKQWLATVQNTLEFPWLFYAFIFLSAEPFLLVLLIPARRSVSAWTKYFSKNMARFPQVQQYKPIMDQLEAQDEHAQRVAGLAEIGLGFFLVVQSLMSGFTGI